MLSVGIPTELLLSPVLLLRTPIQLSIITFLRSISLALASLSFCLLLSKLRLVSLTFASRNLAAAFLAWPHASTFSSDQSCHPGIANSARNCLCRVISASLNLRHSLFLNLNH